MAVEWRNNGEPIDGEYVADVDAEDGSQVQTFKGATYKEVADKLLDAQFHGSRRINDLKRNVSPDPKKPRTEFKPKALSADDRFQLQRDMSDPTKLPEAVSRIVEAQFGAPIEVVRQKLQAADEKEAAENAAAETKLFVERTPDWHPTEENKLALWNYMQTEGMEFTAHNFNIAFDALMEAGLVTMKPDGRETTEEQAPERIVPQATTRPRGSFATGVRSTDVGSIPPGKVKPRYTRQEIDTMPRSVYAQKMNDPEFARFVNSLT